VLGVIVADHVYHQFSDYDEGWLSRARSSVVRASALAEMAVELRLGDVLRLGKGENASGGREKVSILADTLEAVIGAVYLDGGWDAGRAVVLGLIGRRLDALPGGTGDQDDKSRLQELVARSFDGPPKYHIDDVGPEHDKRFFAEVTVDGRVVGHGTGRSKKQAEQLAARAAWQLLDAELAMTEAVTSAADDAPAPAAADRDTNTDRTPSPNGGPTEGAAGDASSSGPPVRLDANLPGPSGPDRTNETLDA
jgi:ribonuclease-3